MKKPRKLSSVLLAIVAVVYVPLTLAVLYIVRSYEQTEAIEAARAAAERMIERSLSIHRYFANELRPAVFALVGEKLPDRYFDARWMSSTYAVRAIRRYMTQANETGFYYKECAVNARSPENEADNFERAFLERSTKDPRVTGWSGVREIEGKPYYVVLRRGESMEESCLLCHSASGRAPRGLVERFGDTRSFGRKAGEMASALSVRIPLAAAYEQAENQRERLVLSISGALALTLLLLYFLGRAYIYSPLCRLCEAVGNVERDEALLGLPIETGGSREIQEVADAFVKMSARVKQHVVELEANVQIRTEHLQEAKERLVKGMEERNTMEVALAANEQRYRSLFSNMTEAFALHEVIVDAEGKVVDYWFLDVNPAFERETGLVRANVVGNTQKGLLPNEDPVWLQSYGKVALTGEPLHLEHYSPVLGKYYEVYAFRPEPLKFAVLFRNVTERRVLEQRLRQAQKMEAIGTLAGGIAHDFNNILTPIMAHGELALMQLPEGDPVRDDISELLSATERAAALVRQILAISRKEDAAAPVPVNVGALVKETAKFLRASIPAMIELRVEADPACGPVLAEPTPLHQVILNLCTNASYAMAEKGGVLTVSVGREAPGDAPGEPTGPRRVRLTVSDTGPGIPAEVQSRIFEPYFTTKPVGKGSGLGLAVVHGVVTSLGGEIRVRSAPGEGATFEVLLPETERPAAPRRVSVGEVPRGNGQCVLAVDDEQAIRSVLKRMLRSLGYRVTVCGNGAEALEAFRADPLAFDAVLTDYTMPGMTGMILAAELRAIRPDLPVILGTGFAEGVDEQTVSAAELRGLLTKPYSAKAVGEALRRALEGETQGRPRGGVSV